MPRDPKTGKKPYSSPILVTLDASAAKAKLQTLGDPRDPVVQKMLSIGDEQLKNVKGKSHDP